MLNCRCRLVQLFVLFFLPILLQAQKQYGGVPTLYFDNQPVVKSNENKSVDLTAEVRSVYTKNNAKNSPSNLVARPVVSTQKKLKYFQKYFPETGHNNTSFLYNVVVGDRVEAHLRLRDFNLPEGGRMFVISEDGDRIFGAYTAANNKESGNFMIGPIQGNFSIEYNAPIPISNKELPFKIDQVYVNPNIGAMDLGFGAAFACQINVNCDEGRRYAKEKNGVMRIQMVADEGVLLCTGSLLNSTSQDGTPYVLSAYHCLVPPQTEKWTPLYDMWSFDFSYESFSCAQPDSEPTFISARGCENLAGGVETDFLLLKITGEIPEEANAYLNGWDRREDYFPTQTSLIHHPAGDIKKISTDFDSIRLHNRATNWNNGTVTPANSHFINNFDDAVYQPGSSGGPLFDDRGRVIGQLHGGPLSDEFCTVGIGYSGRFALSWKLGQAATEQLAFWLDPTNTGEESIGGIEYNQNTQSVSFLGRVVTADGIAIPNVRVSLTGDSQTSFLTGGDGRFLIGNLNKGGTFQIHLEKDLNSGNGVSAIDLVQMMNHIIDTKPLGGVFQKFAADVNQDGKISSIDLVQLRNVIIGRTESFPNSPSWRFEPNILNMTADVGSSGLEVQFTGYKVGDLNNSANPRN